LPHLAAAKKFYLFHSVGKAAPFFWVGLFFYKYSFPFFFHAANKITSKKQSITEFQKRHANNSTFF